MPTRTSFRTQAARFRQGCGAMLLMPDAGSFEQRTTTSLGRWSWLGTQQKTKGSFLQLKTPNKVKGSAA